jgi:hypothetical protein
MRHARCTDRRLSLNIGDEKGRRWKATQALAMKDQ